LWFSIEAGRGENVSFAPSVFSTDVTSLKDPQLTTLSISILELPTEAFTTPGRAMIKEPSGVAAGEKPDLLGRGR